MNFADYQIDAARTFGDPKDPMIQAVRAMGLMGESAELMGALMGVVAGAGQIGEAIKKHASAGHALDCEKVIEEAGDVLWYLTAALALVDATLEDAAANNMAKRLRRYPNGFSAAASQADRVATKTLDAIAPIAYLGEVEGDERPKENQMTTIHATASAYSIRIENHTNWVVRENGQSILESKDGVITDHGGEATQTGSISEEIKDWATCFPGEKTGEDLHAFGVELEAAGW